ncbi:MAG: acyl-CoA dehydrogenase, partial [Dokdonella sp.]
MDFSQSPKARALIERMTSFMRERVEPAQATYDAQLVHGSDWTRWRQPEVIETLKREAKDAGLWNLFLPEDQRGA